MLHTVYSCAENTLWSGSSGVWLPGTSEGGCGADLQPGSAAGFGSQSLLPALRDRAGLGEAWRCPRGSRLKPLAPIFSSLWDAVPRFFQHFLFQTKPKEYNPEQEVFITRDPSPVPAAGLCPRPHGLWAPSTAPSPCCREQTHQTGFQ